MSIVSAGMPLQKIGEGKGGCEAVPVGDTWSLVQGGDSACGRRFLGVVTCDPAGGFHRPFASDCAIGRWSWGVGGVVLNSRPLLSATVLGRTRSRRFAAALRLGMRHDVPSRIGMPTSCVHQSRRGHPALVPTAGTRRVYWAGGARPAAKSNGLVDVSGGSLVQRCGPTLAVG